MSGYGMLGLLEGFGKGAAASGADIKKNILADAEIRRRMNLEKVRRQWAREDAAIDRTNRQEDMRTERTWRQEDNATERGWKKEDTVAEHAWQLQRDAQKFDQTRELQNDQRSWELKNRQPSEYDKKIKLADEALAAGKLSEADHTRIVFGLKESQKGELTAEKRAELKMKALEQASQEMPGADSKEINLRAKEIYQNAVGGDQAAAEGPGQALHPQAIESNAKTIARLPVEDRDKAIAYLKGKGVSDSDLAAISAKASELSEKTNAEGTGDTEGSAQAGPPADPNWQQNLSRENLVVRAVKDSMNKPAEVRKAALEDKRERSRHGFLRPNPYRNVSKGLLEQED